MLVPSSLHSALLHFPFKISSFFAFFSSSTPLHRTTTPSSSSSSFTHLLKQCKSCIKAKLVITGAFSPSGNPTTWSSHVVFWWNNLIKRSVILRHHETALTLFREMLRLDWKPDGYTYPYVLKACGEIKSLICGESVHGMVLLSGLDSNVFVCNGVIAMYGKCGLLGHARQVFDEMLVRGTADVISWNSIVAAYVHKDEDTKVLALFDLMVSLNKFELRPDAVSLVNVLPACGSMGAWRRGKQLHGYAIRRCLHEDVFVGNAVVDMYAKCKRLDDANKVFELMEVKDVVSWNALVTGYSQIGRFGEALRLFERMREEEIDLNVVTWSAVISGYAQRDLGYEALNIFREMRLSRAEPNVITLVSVLSGCAAIGALCQGKETHCYAIKRMLSLEGSNAEEDLMVINALIDMYAKCKEMKIAQAMFDDIDRRDRNVVTWTVMIGGHAQHGDANDAIELFSAMLKDEYSVIPNAYTISSSLVACARLSSLRIGRQVHAYVLRQGYEPTMVFVANCLIDMYAKSGDVDAARLVFDNMSQRNTVSWTSLMTGYGMHGRGEEALQVFNVMRGAGLPIDGVTFLVVLYACSHSGMVDQGMNYFNNMKEDFGVVAGAEHYACMIDILGRAGRLDEAMKLIERMPMEPTSVVWVALLSACRVHKNVDLAEHAAAKLSELESENDGTYTLLSNIYANAKRWKDVARVRSLMKHSGIRKRPGCSWVQGKKETVTFFVGDRSHPMSEKIYDLLEDLIHCIKAMGYIPETSFALHDVDDEEKGDLLIEHSEKLALAYGILTSAPGVPIRITKNLRVCGDCHTAMTYISKIIEHEIILRDSSRFHHIKNGSCSCRGFW
ncbi:pentatricopeptide repeat-containing protein At5g16860-like [Lycium barbarum]|uniref:pentatricopeptide repeat-containing protein At5g16860-like n=1 Tax=Lycium barbarum TaxID=112863 RepID=UPI00293E513B|nr:pentatricopeptide repeat-containing protein At5g16860-like [Lycium barbarum]XP_060204210.1 pentatricopeptide repeat-containing protein At5g16860-like [Lycium barbarum]XP_060204211.1 pentatricopeptide repeat-containing protein At5g16860-like [Lycium barbarum]XP_060204212.1 pentatricopeptide repeat-containing protein At5g16860-like [Lycium barbarum]XP_060204213.1 pentatricopeptide repeat-containing protein At5g16860-like [Lycium barbarum]